MGKIVSVTSQEIRKEWTPQKLALLESETIPSFDTDITDTDYSSGRVKPIARGLDEFKEYLKEKGQPLIEDPQDPEVNISVRIPRSYAKGLRATGRGWKTKVGEYLVNAIKRGEFGKIL